MSTTTAIAIATFWTLGWMSVGICNAAKWLDEDSPGWMRVFAFCVFPITIPLTLGAMLARIAKL